VIRGELNVDAFFTVGINDTVPILICNHFAAEHACPEAAFGFEVRGVEHNNLAGDLHEIVLSFVLQRIVRTIEDR
jgi:hypothetical protein